MQALRQPGIAAKAFNLPFAPAVQGDQVDGQHQVFARRTESQGVIAVTDFLHAQPAEVMLRIDTDIHQQLPLQWSRRLQEVGMFGLRRLNRLHHLQGLLQFVAAERIMLWVQGDAGVFLQQAVNTGKTQQLGEAGRLFEDMFWL